MSEHSTVYPMPMNFAEWFHAATKKDMGTFFIPDRERLILNVGGGYKHLEGTYNLDYPEWDAETQQMPYGDGSIGGIYAFGFLEHIKNVPWVLSEFQRVLAPLCPATIMVPYYSSQLYAQDLAHVSPFCEETWRCLFNNACYDKSQFGVTPTWKFKVGMNLIIGKEERNIFLLTQLIKLP